ncbi:MAG TPA: DUF3515 domain-containing protein, partial [Microbacteriaceae bacterium]|nr:DUF3515 domain-containing protein [Microbacteriaceae bacterium]
MALDHVRRLAALAAAACLVPLVAGCTATVSLPPAAHADSPDCAAVTVRLPASVAGLAKRATDSQATAAWGSPPAVL